MKKLYAVEMGVKVYVMAEDPAKAGTVAYRSLRDPEAAGVDTVSIEEVTKDSSVRSDWLDSLPFGGDGKTLIRDIQNEMDKQMRKLNKRHPQNIHSYVLIRWTGPNSVELGRARNHITMWTGTSVCVEGRPERGPTDPPLYDCLASDITEELLKGDKEFIANMRSYPSGRFVCRDHFTVINDRPDTQKGTLVRKLNARNKHKGTHGYIVVDGRYYFINLKGGWHPTWSTAAKNVKGLVRPITLSDIAELRRNTSGIGPEYKTERGILKALSMESRALGLTEEEIDMNFTRTTTGLVIKPEAKRSRYEEV